MYAERIRSGLNSARLLKPSGHGSGSRRPFVGEKLLNFAEAASRAPDFARELPRFVSEVRRMFTPDEIGTHLARIERAQKENEVEENDPLREDPTATAERVRQFRLIKELLTATTLGTS